MYTPKFGMNFDLGTATFYASSGRKYLFSLLILLRTTKSKFEDEILINFLLLSGHVIAVLDERLGLIVLQCKWRYKFSRTQDSALTKVWYLCSVAT